VWEGTYGFSIVKVRQLQPQAEEVTELCLGLMPGQGDDEDRRIVSVHDPSPIPQAHLIDEAKLARVTLDWRGGQVQITYRTYLMQGPPAIRTVVDEVGIFDGLMPCHTSRQRLTGLDTDSDPAPSAQHQEAAEVVAY
jgi:hypothetical protein